MLKCGSEGQPDHEVAGDFETNGVSWRKDIDKVGQEKPGLSGTANVVHATGKAASPAQITRQRLGMGVGFPHTARM